jgi:transposase-like protein
MDGLSLAWWIVPAYPLSTGERAMSTQRFTLEFKEEAVKQFVQGGYTVPDVAAGLRFSTLSLYK